MNTISGLQIQEESFNSNTVNKIPEIHRSVSHKFIFTNQFR